MNDLRDVHTSLRQPTLGQENTHCWTLYRTLHIIDGYIS